MVVIDRLDDAPADPAGLQDPQGMTGIGVKETHPGIHDEHMETVVGQQL